MNIEEIRNYCLEKTEANESFPFDETSLVFKLENKIFAILSLDDDFSINLKCDPEEAIHLRAMYPYVFPGFHMNKTHWNTIKNTNEVPDHLLKLWIDNSYRLVFRKLPKKLRDSLQAIKDS